MDTSDNEDKLLHSVALQNARSILQARDRTEAQLVQAKEALEQRTRELAQQREWFQVTLSSIGDAVITTDIEERVTFLNPVAELATGWKSAEALGKPLKEVFNIINEETRQPTENPVHKVLAEGITVSLINHTALIAKDGTETAIEDSAAPIRDNAGNISGAVMVFHEVTQRRQAEAALRRSHDQFFALVNYSPVRVLLVDSRLRLRQVNDKAALAFGNIENLIGRDLDQVMNILWSPSVAAKIVERFRQTLETGEPFFEYGFSEPRADRVQQEYYDWQIHRVTLPDGQHGVACYFIDISQHALAQLELMERARLAALRAEISGVLASGDNLRTVLGQCAQALTTHLDGVLARIWTINEAANVLELQASVGLYTHLNGPHSRIKIGDYKIGRIAQHRQALLTNDVIHDENISDPAWAQREGIVAFAGFPLVLEDRVLGVMAMFARHPLSDSVLKELAPIADAIAQWLQRRRTEEALSKARLELQQYAANLEKTVEERTAELREKIGELESFSYSVSHDMRSPLRAMQGYATALLVHHKQNLNDEGRHYLERIHKASTRMDLLIQEVLTYSTVAKEELTFQPVDLERLIPDVIQSYPAFQAPKAVISVKSPLPKVLGHEALLTQVISNLLGNAVKFVKPGVTPRVLIHGESTGALVRVCFDDNGIGIDPAHFKRIFEIFGRVYGDKKFEGTGIGLAIAKKAAERMGGEIGVESQLDHGSRFWFTLKRAE